MAKSKTLKMFLLDGEPTGVKIVEMSNWTGKAFVIPRNKLKNVIDRAEFDSQAVYFLIGEEASGDQIVYVGEAEEFRKRILQHNQCKDFWKLSVCFISKDDNLTKAHIKYLESEIIGKIKKAGRIKLDNGNDGSVPKLPESDESDMLVFLENLRIVMSSLGFVFLEDLSVVNESGEEKYFVAGRNAKGIVKLTNEGFAVQKGSIISGNEAESLSGSSLSVIRFQVLHSESARKLDDGNYELKENVVFSSPSYASSFILGMNSNGWIKLKNEKGETLDELKRGSDNNTKNK